MRPGPISKEAIEAIISTKIEKTTVSLQNELVAPGMLKSHYSPITPLEIRSHKKLKKIAESCDKIGIAYIFLKRPKMLPDKGSNNVYWLSENGEEFEIARNLYRILRSLDNLNYTKIYIEAIDKDCGINVALQDRLSRASQKKFKSYYASCFSSGPASISASATVTSSLSIWLSSRFPR